MTINNDVTRIEYNEFYAGNFHILINCINENLNAYFIASKFNNLDDLGAIHRINHSNTAIQVVMAWEKNKPIEIFTTNNLSNIAFNIQIKIFSM